MSALPSAGGGYGALHLVLPDDGCNGTAASPEFLAPNAAASSGANKRKRRPAGTPDPGAEVVALSPKTLMESDRYVCEICNQGFQRDQNLQMHRRRHKVPWKLLKRPSLGTNKRVYICPERSCLHHDPAHALGDLVGIKKHYRRKHCTEKQWKCDKCSKGYAVQSDYKAHLKTCGTRGHCCDCGRVFSRVESFIEHQDTCSAVKHKAVQSGGGISDKVKSSSAPHHGTDSPSQSSDTTQAMSFAHSGMSDTAARSSADHTKVTDEHSRRIQESQAVAASPSSVAAASPMPAWLRDHALHNELELLPSKHRVPAEQAKARVARCNSITFPPTESKSTLEPSLQLSMGPYGPEVASSSLSPYVDSKPIFSSAEREAALALVHHQRQTSAGDGLIPSSRSDKALSVPSIGKEGEKGDAVAMSGFLMQAMRRQLRPVATSQAGESSEGLVHQQYSTRKHHNSRTEMVANYNPCAAGGTSSYHEDSAAHMHESAADAPGTWVMPLRGFINAQLEPATSSVISSRHALLDHRDVAETDDLVAANSKSVDEAFRLQKDMAAGAHAEAICVSEQARTDHTNVAWSDLERVRRSKNEAREECEEAQRGIARAQILKQEAREQLQFAAAEQAYAERAREVAKRQIEISEAELARAKRLREHAQLELDKAGNSLAAISSQPAFCLSCKSALQPNLLPSRNLPTSPGSSTWPLMTPNAPNVEPSDQGMQAGSSGLNLWPSDRLNLWPMGYRSMSTSAASMAMGESPLSGAGPDSRVQLDRDHKVVTPKLDFDLN